MDNIYRAKNKGISDEAVLLLLNSRRNGVNTSQISGWTIQYLRKNGYRIVLVKGTSKAQYKYLLIKPLPYERLKNISKRELTKKAIKRWKEDNKATGSSLVYKPNIVYVALKDPEIKPKVENDIELKPRDLSVENSIEVKPRALSKEELNIISVRDERDSKITAYVAVLVYSAIFILFLLFACGKLFN